MTLLEWLTTQAWPLWLDRGIDRKRGSFLEALDLTHHGCHAPYRRLRVAARQIVVFSAAHAYGLAGAEDAVRIGLDFLDRHAAQAECGYAWRFDLDHKVIDATRDLYDHAFVLLAFASAQAAMPALGLRGRALSLFGWMERAFAHELGGYVESLPPALPRRQNPHMHLLEALLACHDSFGDAMFLDRAAGLVTLFTERLFDHATGALPEYFDDRLRPVREQGRFLVEPGHHHEWIWLLDRYRCCAGADAALSDLAARLGQFADLYGNVPGTGDVRNALWSDGAVQDGAARLWPQTERLRAEGLRRDRPGRSEEAAASLAAWLRPDGLWHERRGPDGVFSNDPAPASSLYHLTGAILAI